MANRYEQPRLLSSKLHEEENGEEPQFEESSNELLMEEMTMELHPQTMSSYDMFILTISLAGLVEKHSQNSRG